MFKFCIATVLVLCLATLLVTDQPALAMMNNYVRPCNSYTDGYGHHHHKKNCTIPAASSSITTVPTPSFPGGGSIDVYVPTTANCATAFASITSYNFVSGNLSQYRQCRSLVLCLNMWLELLLQLILAGLTPGATFSNTLSSTVTDLNTAFGYVNSVLGGILSQSGTSVSPPTTGTSACTAIFAPVLAANGNIYASSCVAAAAGAPNPYVSVTLNSGATAVNGVYTISDITNPRIALTTLYTNYVLKILGFITTYLSSCSLSTESRVYTNGISTVNSALSSIASGDNNAAKNLLFAFSQNV